MANKLSDLIQSNSNIIAQSAVGAELAMHALKRDEDGLLTYTKVKWDSDEEIAMTTGDGFAFTGVEEFVEGINIDGVVANAVQFGTDSEGSQLTNYQHKNYEQVRFDNQKLFYFINDQGFLVARYQRDYSHSGPV